MFPPERGSKSAEPQPPGLLTQTPAQLPPVVHPPASVASIVVASQMRIPTPGP